MRQIAGDKVKRIIEEGFDTRTSMMVVSYILEKGWTVCEQITEEDLDAVRKLGVIINLAASLDRSRNQNVMDICCDILGDSIIMKTIVKEDATFDDVVTLIEDVKKIVFEKFGVELFEEVKIIR